VTDAAFPIPNLGIRPFGWGREMGHDALELYTEKKAVCTML
jgi:phenylacetaldehyde dehydrogenase